jgi:hypothetical protein
MLSSIYLANSVAFPVRNADITLSNPLEGLKALIAKKRAAQVIVKIVFII